jgi:hypothetical protein
MSRYPATTPPGARRLRSRAAIAAATALLVVTVLLTAPPPTAAQQATTTGPCPVLLTPAELPAGLEVTPRTDPATGQAPASGCFRTFERRDPLPALVILGAAIADEPPAATLAALVAVFDERSVITTEPAPTLLPTAESAAARLRGMVIGMPPVGFVQVWRDGGFAGVVMTMGVDTDTTRQIVERQYQKLHELVLAVTYEDGLNDNIDRLVDGLVAVGRVMRAPQPRDPAWLASHRAAWAEVQIAAARIQNLTPPACLSQAHATLSRAFGLIDQAGRTSAHGADTGNLLSLRESLALVEQAGPLLQQGLREVRGARCSVLG